MAAVKTSIEVQAVLDGTARWCVLTGDALAELRALPDGCCGCLVTDPPYSSGGMVRGDRMASTRDKYQSTGAQEEFASFSGDNRDQRSFGYWSALWLSECRRIVVPGGMACVFTDWRQLPTSTDAMQSGGWVWRGVVPWDKVVARPMPGRFRAQAEYIVWGTNGPRETDTEGGVYGNGIISIRTPPTAEREHSTQKPVELIQEVLKTAALEDAVVLDPFAGSGTTGVACVKNGLRFIGFELDEHYAKIARARIRKAEASCRLFAGGGA